MKSPEKAPEEEPAEAPQEPEQQAAEELPEPPKDRKTLDKMVAKYGIDVTIEALKKVRVVDLRSWAREYNGEFGIAGREIRNANKKVLIDEFKAFFTK